MTRYRYRVFLDHEPSRGATLILPPESVTERWEADKVLHNVPVRDTNTEPLRVEVSRVIGQRATNDPEGRRILTDRHSGAWEVITEDPAPFRAKVGAVLTIFGTPLLCEPADLFALLERLAGFPLRTDEQRTAVAAACAPWLADLVPVRMLDVARWVIDHPYDTPAEYAAYVDGVTASGGWQRVTVPAPPFMVEIPPDRILAEETVTLAVRADAAEQIARHGRAN